MKISLYYVSSKKILDFEDYQSKLIKQISSFSDIEVKAFKESPNKDPFLKHINEKDYIVLFDERGESCDSLDFSEKLKKYFEIKSKIIFLIGASDGFSSEMQKRADQKIRISDMTLNHALARLVALEQIYRALSILNKHPYHK